MSLKRGERQTKFDHRVWMGVRMHRRHAFRGRRQAAPENQKPTPMAAATFWRRHPEPFAKRPQGWQRRAARLFRLAHKAVACDRTYDDGWHSMEGTGCTS
jgi:hypothetical protein